MVGIRLYIAECLEKALLIVVAFGVSFVIGAGLSMGAIWGAAYMLSGVQP